jgi:hypothetical protein
MIRTYRELIRLKTFEERFEYLVLGGIVGRPTFGFDRWINQRFYHSTQWQEIRRDVIVRDNGCDLAMPGYEIHNRLVIHHMNPMIQDDILRGSPNAIDLEHLICTTHQTHNAIHYGDKSLLPKPFVERKPGDTQLWRRRRS